MFQVFAVVHRDIKPSNILLTKRSSTEVKAVLCDFGISTQIEVGHQAANTVEARGTAGWKAPELCFYQDDNQLVRCMLLNDCYLFLQMCTTAVDIFAMGCVVYYVLSSGGHPFVAGSKSRLEDAADFNIKTEANNELKTYKKTYPLKVLSAGYESNTAIHLIKQMIAKKDKDRYTNRLFIACTQLQL